MGRITPRQRGVLGVTAAATLLLALLSFASPAAAVDAIDCATSTVFVGQTQAGVNQPTTLYSLDISQGGASFTALGSSTPRYNALAYNAADSHLYAISFDKRLLQVGPDGSTDILGAVSGLPADTAIQFNEGTFADDGTYYVAAAQLARPRMLYRVDIATRTATQITLAPAISATGGDMTYLDGYLWSTNTNGQFVRTDPATGTVSTFPNTLFSGVFGSNWAFGNGNLGILDNLTGNTYEVQITSPGGANPTFTVASSRTGPAAANTDGTSCISPPADLSVDKTGPDTVAPGGLITWTVTVTNEGTTPSSGHAVIDDIPADVTDVASPDEGCTVTGNRVECGSSILQPGESVSYTITGTAPTGAGTIIDNIVEVNGFEEDSNPDNDTDDHQTEVVDTGIPLVASLPAGLLALGIVAAGVLVLRRRASATT
jgi:uncharacterized repeat protein (TIGR01451 family)